MAAVASLFAPRPLFVRAECSYELRPAIDPGFWWDEFGALIDRIAPCSLEFQPDLPPEKVRETAELLRSTARQALEELRDVIGVLRPGREPPPRAPQPTLSDIPRLVQETRRAGTAIDFEMRVDHPDTAPGALGRDAYRIVQESLTNIGKHAPGTAGRVRVTGAAEGGLHVNVRNRLPVQHTGPALPGAGAGLLGLQERVTLAGGTLVHGPDGAGDFVVDAELRW